MDIIEIKCLFINPIGNRHKMPLHTPTVVSWNAGNNTTCWRDEEQLDRARALLVAMQNGPITLENGWAVSYQVKIYIYHRAQESHSNVFSQENWKLLFTQKTGTQIFIAAVFIIAEIWKRIPWINWYNHHMLEGYLAKNKYWYAAEPWTNRWTAQVHLYMDFL